MRNGARRTTTIIAAAATTLFCLVSRDGSAQTIGWHPSSPVYLGANLDPDNPREAKVPCLKDPTKGAIPVDTGAPSTEFKSTLVSERRELYNAFSVSASFAASSGLSGGGGSISSLNEVTFDSETIVWSLQARTNYGRTSLANVQIKEEFAKLPAASLQALCGTHFVVMDRREAVVAAIFVFRSTSQKTRDDLKVALSANWSGGSFSASLSNEIKKSLKRTEIKFVFIAKGGEGLSGTSGFVTSFDKFDELRADIAKYIAGVSREKAPAAEYFIAKLPTLPSMTLLLDARERTLSNAWSDYLKYDQMLSEAKRHLANIERHWYLDPSVLKVYLQGVAEEAAKRIDKLGSVVNECVADKARCNYTPDVQIPLIAWPSINPYNNGSGYGCTGDVCTGSADFLLLIRGPGKPKSIRVDRIGLAFPGSDFGYNCRYRTAPVVSVEGVQFRCTTGFKKSTLDKSNLELHIFDLVNGMTALRIPFADVAPDFRWPDAESDFDLLQGLFVSSDEQAARKTTAHCCAGDAWPSRVTSHHAPAARDKKPIGSSRRPLRCGTRFTSCTVRPFSPDRFRSELA